MKLIPSRVEKGENIKYCLSPGSNRGPLVCETNVITNYTTQTSVNLFHKHLHNVYSISDAAPLKVFLLNIFFSI